jgi:alpha-glucosidase
MRTAIIIVLSLCALSVAGQEVFEFSLEYDNLPSVELAAGNFTVRWNGEQGSLSVLHQDDDRILWQSIPGYGFAGGAIAEAHIEEERGFFTIDDEKISVLDVQVIDTIYTSGDSAVISGRLLNDSISAAYTFSLAPRTGRQLGISLQAEEMVNRTYLTYSMDDDTGIFGFGAQCSHFNHRGNRVPVLVQEQGIGRGDIDNILIQLVLGTATGNDYTSYISVPQYSTSELNAFFLENYEISNFDFTGSDIAQVEVFSDRLAGRIIYGHSHPGLIEEYTAWSGRMRPLPDWAIDGAIVGLQGGTQKLYDIWEQLRSKGTPLSAFWIQDWVGQRVSIVGKQLWWNWELEKPRYPGYEQMLDSLNAAGIELMGYINPFLVNVYQQKAYRRNQYVEGQTNGFLVRREDGYLYLVEQTSFNSAILDLSNPGTRRWIKDIIIDELIARGFKGWMADFAEALPFDGVLDSADPATYHNQYAEEWARINREAIEEAGFGNEIVFFSRSGYSRSPGQSTLFWMGDQMVNWAENDGIKSAVTGLLSGGMSGFSLNHSDIGGYATIDFEPFVPLLNRSPELLRRWTEMNAFSAVFRTHEGLGPEINAQIYSDEAALEHFSKWAKVYNAWFFYRKELVTEAAATGLPVVRHPVIHYPYDEYLYDLSYQQFMVGDQFMVAPVTEPGIDHVDIYLPSGEWVDLWTGQAVSSIGEVVTVTGLEERPAVFYPAGSEVAQQFIQHLIEAGVY